MGKTTKRDRIAIFLSTTPKATHKQIYEAVNSDGKDHITLPYCSKIACAWRKERKIKPRGKKKQSTSRDDDEIELDSELTNILSIMLLYKKKGIKVQFREIHEYLKYKGSITLEAEEQKLAVKKLTNEELLMLILGDPNSEDVS